MGYRDEREALRQRAEGLAEELAVTKRELEEARARLEAHEGKDVEDERRIKILEQKLAALVKPAPKESAPPDDERPIPFANWIGVIIFVIVAAAILVYLFTPTIGP
jgi:hypothetical protein